MLAAPRHSPASVRAAQRGGTLLGFMVGLVLGLSIAVVVAVFITQAPVPFVNKANRAADRVAEPKSPAEAPDPNRPLNPRSASGDGRPVAVAPAAAPGAADASDAAPPNTIEDKASMLDRLFGKGAAESAGIASPGAAPAGAPAQQAAVKGDARGVDAPKPDSAAGRSEAAREDRTNYLLQAGAFRTQDDAEAMKAKLAFIGFEARIVVAEVNGQTMHRVRLGPYAQLDEMNKARSRLAENGIEASVVRVR
jgi:cell division protein FtsN